jgi:gamma-glutamyltranspeptidase / glutathione hydrolase
VSLIQSNYAAFGSGITVRGMGFALQNRGALFLLDPTHPNALAPHKRPFHTIIPAFMERGDQHIGFGIMGGPNQPLAHAQFVSNVVDYGMNIQAALEAARFTVSPLRGCNVLIESRVKPDTLQRLTAMGHKLEIRQEYSSEMGRGQAVLHDSKSKVNYGASDARADGSAEPEPPPKRLIDTGGYAKKDRITHRIEITKASDIDAEVKRWLGTAYEIDESKAAASPKQP